jgi:hypothetical protein
MANDSLLASDDGFFMMGATDLEFEPEQRRDDVYLVETNAAGDILWGKTYGGQRYEAGATAFPLPPAMPPRSAPDPLPNLSA